MTCEETITETGRPNEKKIAKQDRYTRKKNKNSNVSYYSAKGYLNYSAKGYLINAKQFVDYKCSCKQECHLKINKEERQKNFTEF